MAGPDAGSTALELPRDAVDVRVAAGRVGRTLSTGTTRLDASGVAGDRLAALVDGLLLGSYRWTESTRNPVAPRTVLLCGTVDEAAAEAGRRSAAATLWARDLANTPAATKTPQWFAEQARDTLSPLGVRVEIRDEVWLAEHGFGGVLAVGRGAASPPRLIEATWRPRGAPAGQHPVLVGKGITFDTGGLNRKTGDGMRTMATDMSGGAAVLAAVRLIAEQRLPIRVTALVPTAENSLGAAAMRPSDVIRHVGGRTSEIDNTDAEGRLVLADALAYAARRLRPSALVDIATLTGAMKVALGLRTAGVLGTDALVADLVAAGTAAGEPAWAMPLPVEYEQTLDSPVADATNAPGNPGGLTAALFLRPFAGDVPWAHLDVAGPARATAADGMFSRGATGYGARLLAEWVSRLPRD